MNISQKVLLETIENELAKYTLPEIFKQDFTDGLLEYFDEMDKKNGSNILRTRRMTYNLKKENYHPLGKNLIRKKMRVRSALGVKN